MSSLAYDYDDPEDIDEDINRFAESFLAQHLDQLPDENFEKGLRTSVPSLDDELGENNVWDVPLDCDSETNLENLLSEQLEATEGPTKRTAHEMLLHFDPQDPPASDSLEDLQLWLECEAQRESVLRYQNVIESAREREDYMSMGLVQQQLVQWYQPLKDAIVTEQRRYLLKKGKQRKGMNRYGPYLCTLQPEKLAIITAHEALVHTLTAGGGATLASTAKRIGAAVEAEVNVQQLLKHQMLEAQRQRESEESNLEASETKKEAESTAHEEGSAGSDVSGDTDEAVSAVRSWMYGPSHLQRFMEEGKKEDIGKKKRVRIAYANRRAKQLLKRSDTWSDTDKIKLGVALLDQLLGHATISANGHVEKAFSYEQGWTDNKRVGRIHLNDKLYRMVVEDSFDSLAASTTRHKPMIVPPREWVEASKGGYAWLKVDMMRTHGSDVQKEALLDADLSMSFDGLNVLGRVPWIINKEVLEIAHQCWQRNIALGDIPSRDDIDVPPVPIRPERIPEEQFLDKESAAYKDGMAELRAYHEAMVRHRRAKQKNMDLRSLRCSTMLKLDQAEKFKDFEEIYFPYNMDFRGRAYPIPPHLSNVGSDLCRGILKFAKKKPLGPKGLYWLKVHLANLAGNDKISFDDRARYTEEHMERVRAAVNDPLGPDRWWMSLDDPFQGLATCHEIVNAIDSGDPESYECALPVHMDGSCNGLQHYAALGRDSAGGKVVNMTKAEEPQDVYSGVMEEVIRLVAEEAAVELDFDENDEKLSKEQKKELRRHTAAKLVNGLIDRGVVKRTVMTSVYGVTFIGARKQIQEKIEEKLEDKGVDVDTIENEIHAACGYLASVTMDVISRAFTGASENKNWLTTCARLIAHQGHPVAWVSPIGVPVVQPYRRSQSHTIVTLLQSVVLVDNSDDLPIHKQRQVTAFPPNFIHSLDSSHMLLTALEMDRRGLTFSAVHDSFWTHPCDVDEMNEALRDCFVELYEQPLLERLKMAWELRYPSIEFPDVPAKGDLNLNVIKSAPYFFQ